MNPLFKASSIAYELSRERAKLTTYQESGSNSQAGSEILSAGISADPMSELIQAINKLNINFVQREMDITNLISLNPNLKDDLWSAGIVFNPVIQVVYVKLH
ncbi:hypothetical protein A0J61_10573 [Choanephora cucurbitarum]|uniref:Uncharacterized protein n=1 Tax=Choanephora cucurbitarum TaxID=101091 RepID=A0A1C7MYA0_9FUNG|nr:hypothetical protein A0J61_10573 [Choanephora cucurbitarum]